MTAWLYFGIIIALVVVLFIFGKRPMYEVMFLAFVILCIISGNLINIGRYFMCASSSYLPYTLTGFVIFAVIFEKTGIINDLIMIIAALVGRFHGGAGYMALLATAAMGSFCGSGPGNAVATGSITIPAMKKTGYTPELAAVVSAAGSTLGPIIPPSAAIPIIFEILNSTLPGRYTSAQFWMFAWPISLWLIIQRIMTLFFMVRKMNVQPIPESERPSVKEALRHGWPSLIMPVTLFAPFLVGIRLQNTIITEQLGSVGASHFSSLTLCTVPAFACFLSIILYTAKGNRISLKKVHSFFSDALTSVVPVIIVTFSGYAINALFNDLGVSDAILATMSNLHLTKLSVIIICPLFFTFMGMFIETSTLYLLFGPIFIPLAISVGINPMIAAMSVNVMTNAMGQLTPPFALCVLVSVGIAEADFKKTTLLTIPWCVSQLIIIIIYLAGYLPMFGMVF